MTTTTFQHGTPQQVSARLQETLDAAAEHFRREPSISFCLTSLRDTHSFSVFTVTAAGEIECVDPWLRIHRIWLPGDWVHGRGFTVSPGTLPYPSAVARVADAIARSLRASFGEEYAAKVVIRQVRA